MVASVALTSFTYVPQFVLNSSIPVLFGGFVDFLQQRILKGDVDGYGAHGWLLWYYPFA
jgi:hypothetical protein